MLVKCLSSLCAPVNLRKLTGQSAPVVDRPSARRRRADDAGQTEGADGQPQGLRSQRQPLAEAPTTLARRRRPTALNRRRTSRRTGSTGGRGPPRVLARYPTAQLPLPAHSQPEVSMTTTPSPGSAEASLDVLWLVSREARTYAPAFSSLATVMGRFGSRSNISQSSPRCQPGRAGRPTERAYTTGCTRALPGAVRLKLLAWPFPRRTSHLRR